MVPLLALEGVRVIEIATDVAGPFCGKLLADYGAEVIKIEPPGDGDPSRRAGPFPDGLAHLEKSALFLHLNTNKSSVTLDLESESARDLFEHLIGQSQVLIESGKPGWLESLGLGHNSLKQLRPDLVMTSVTPFGQTGPSKDYEYTELTIFATGGAMYREGMPSREPLRYGAEVAQYFAGTSAAAATMAACLSSALTGDGRWIDVSIQECMAGHPHQIGRRAPFAYSGELDLRRQPHTPFFGGREPYAVGTFRCRDGFASFLPLGPRMWPRKIGSTGATSWPRSSGAGWTCTAGPRSSRRLRKPACPAAPSYRLERWLRMRTSHRAASSWTSTIRTRGALRTPAYLSLSPALPRRPHGRRRVSDSTRTRCSKTWVSVPTSESGCDVAG